MRWRFGIRTESGLPLAILVGAVAASTAVMLSRPAPANPPRPALSEAELVERGRYLAKIAGCNDCHTAGYALSGGNVPEEQWLMGDKVGFRGPWGTTYPINLRLHLQALSEEQWLDYVTTVQTRPPMPWFAMRDMTQEDRRALYRYIRHLGPAGEPAPSFLPPPHKPEGRYVQYPE